MIFNLKKKDKDIKAFYKYCKCKSVEVPDEGKNVDVADGKTLYIRGYKDSNKVDTSLTITSNSSIISIKISKLKKRWQLTPKESSGNYGNEGNGNGPVVNVEIGGV